MTPNPTKYAFAKRKLLVFGCGFLGKRVVARAVCGGHAVWATTRKPERAAELAQQGAHPLVVDWEDRRTLKALPEVDQVLVAVSFDRRSRLSRVASQLGGFENLLDALPRSTHVCYISTTGVYHQDGHVWVDENSPTRPRREGGRIHLWAEQLLWRRRPHSPWTVLRLAGIYGPGRVPRIANVQTATPIPVDPAAFLNLIHVEDAAAAVEASWQRATRRLYVVADDHPVRRGDFYREIARQTGAAEPTFSSSDQTPFRTSRSEGSKRVWNRRLRRDLLPKLHYPTYREGLRHVLGDDARPPLPLKQDGS